MPHIPDTANATVHFKRCMVSLGLDPDNDPSLAETPERVVSFLAEATANYRSKPVVTRLPVYDRNTELKLTTFKSEGLSQMVFEGGMHFSSICAHHFLPFYGTAYVGYVPNTKILGLSKFPRIVDFFAKAPNTQEYLTKAILDYTVETLEPWFAMVMLKAQHTCVSCRGPFKPTAQTITTSLHAMDTAARAETSKQEFLQYVSML